MRSSKSEVPNNDPLNLTSTMKSNFWQFLDHWNAKPRSQRVGKLWSRANEVACTIPGQGKSILVSYKSWSMLCLKTVLKKSFEQHQKKTFEVITNQVILQQKTWSWNFTQLKSNQLKCNMNRQPSHKLNENSKSPKQRNLIHAITKSNSQTTTREVQDKLPWHLVVRVPVTRSSFEAIKCWYR